MAARKLQAEIDRTLKTVAQGVELFEQLYDKLQASTNQTQKEKLESDLKTQIKKLQRLRDQIKGWVGNNDIKDKKPLLDNRKLIETQMERFKATEKEMKTKAFSKEGLIAAAKLDPQEKAKMEMSNWLSGQVDELSRQIETSEAEIEQAAAGASKKSKKSTGGSNERVSGLETLNERRNWHVGRLEILLRMLENGTLEVEDVETVKDDIAYYVESNAEEDFEEDEGIYDEFNLDEEEEAFGLQQNDDILSSHDGASVTDEPPKTPVKESAIAKARRDSEDPTKIQEMDKSAIPGMTSVKKATRKVTDPTSTTPSKPTEKEKSVPAANFSQVQVKPPVPVPVPTPTSTATSSSAAATAPVLSPPKAPGSTQLPPIRYAAAAAAAVSPSSTNSVLPGISPTSQPTAASAPVVAAPSEPASEVKEESTQPTSVPVTAQVASPAVSNAQSNTAASLTQSVAASEVRTKEEQVAAGPPPGMGASGPPGLVPRSQSPSQATTSSPSLTYSSARGDPSQPSPAISHSSAAAPAPSSSSASGVLNMAPGSNLQENKGPGSSGPPMANQPLQQQEANSPSSFQPAQLAASSAAAGVVQPLGGGAGTKSQQLQAQKISGTESRLPSSLSDLVTSFESVKQKSLSNQSKNQNQNQVLNNLNSLHESLENSFINVPEPIDSEKPKYYIPKNPFNTPGYYPQTPPVIFENPSIYSKFDVDTLFYIFYYQQGTYHQYLAAKELKKQSWRFHKQYLTWFQRHSEPQAITDEYEQGVYVYFDWENSWCQRKKSDFRFEYRWLEEN